MELRLRKLQGSYVIDVIGELDLHNTQKLKDLFDNMIDTSVSSIILNLDGVHYLDSNGVDTLIELYSVSRQKDVAFCLANVHSSARKTLELSRLSSFFPSEETLDDALAANPNRIGETT